MVDLQKAQSMQFVIRIGIEFQLKHLAISLFFLKYFETH